MSTQIAGQPGESLTQRVAAEVRALMGRRGINQRRLSLAIGLSQQAVSRRTRGEVAFDLDDLERIAPVLEVSVADLLGMTEDWAARQPARGGSPDITGDNPAESAAIVIPFPLARVKTA